jgi:hypothetical protein
MTIWTVVPGTLYIINSLAEHPIAISNPFPQGNVTSSSKYITIVMPRVFPVFPPLSPLQALLLLGLIPTASVIGVLVVEIYGRIRPRESTVRKPPQIIIEADDKSESTKPSVEPIVDLRQSLQAYIEANPAMFNLSGNIYPDTIEIRARADRLNLLAAEAKGILRSRIDMNDYTVNADLLVQQGRETADGHMKRIASLLLGKVLEYERETKLT